MILKLSVKTVNKATSAMSHYILVLFLDSYKTCLILIWCGYFTCPNVDNMDLQCYLVLNFLFMRFLRYWWYIQPQFSAYYRYNNLFLHTRKERLPIAPLAPRLVLVTCHKTRGLMWLIFITAKDQNIDVSYQNKSP